MDSQRCVHFIMIQNVLPPCCFDVIILFISHTIYIYLAFLMNLITSLMIFHRYVQNIILYLLFIHH
jgi:hypothetical protein